MVESNIGVKPMDIINAPEIAGIADYLNNPENILAVEPGLVCGDGRYTREQSGGKLARFGADGGYVLGLLAINKKYNLGFTPQQVVDAVVESAIRMTGKAYFHTDDHKTYEVDEIGCGHLAKAALSENSEKYGVEAETVKEAIGYIKELAQKNPEFVEIVKLVGPHKEQAVIYNMGETKKIAHRNGDLEFFVVDVVREQKHAQKLLPLVKNQLQGLREINLDEDEFGEVLEKQTNTTAQILANGFKIFKVNADDPQNILIEEAGVVGQAA